MTSLLLIIYVAFISLGLPDSVLGSIWPHMQPELGAGLSLAGYVSMTVTLGTVISSLLCDQMVRRFGTGKVTSFSVLLTALALVGYALAPSAGWLFVFALPLGLGGGCVDVALNNYVTLHYEAKHMSWLHCFWGVGASAGPVIVSIMLRYGGHWRGGYGLIAGLQILLCLFLFRAHGQWKTTELPEETSAENTQGAFSVLLHTKGIGPVLAAFIFYCALESTSGLWAATFMHQRFALSSADAATASTVFYGGLTAGRYLSGYGAKRFSDQRLIGIGLAVCFAGVFLLLVAPAAWIAMTGICLLGVGQAPMYPSMLHCTPQRFGVGLSQSIMGLEMAFAYVGLTTLPPLFGVLAQRFGAQLLPWYLLGLAVCLTVTCLVAYGTPKKSGNTVQ